LSISFGRSVVAVFLGCVLASTAPAQGNPHVTVRPQVRVVEKVDTKKSTLIANTVPAAVAIAVDRGRLAASTPLIGLKLVLKSSDEQENALRGLIDDQQDKSSPNYHKWLTPETFGNSFGAASADVAKVSAWLQDQGFTVDSVSPSNRVIQFSGTTGQLEAAFQTEMHHITVNGEAHISNTKDLSVPSALSPVIAGVASLNDFYPRSSRAVNPRKLVMGTDGQLHPVIPNTNSPDYTSLTSGSHYVGPGDLATIYNGTPLMSSGIDGTGVTIGIIGQTSISLADVQTYRQLFKLPVNDPTIINVGPPPATIGDDIESDLDLELAGALAVNAKISFYTSGGSLLDGGVSTSALTAVDTNGVDIISLSYSSPTPLLVQRIGTISGSRRLPKVKRSSYLQVIRAQQDVLPAALRWRLVPQQGLTA
jgi:subtilase family serine protease